MANYLVTDTELTNVANSIREKGGTTASLSWPTGYVNAVNDIEVGVSAYAVISVSYPAGSVCTCSKGDTMLTAEGTSGLYNFLVPESGSWIINCTNGSNSVNTTANVTKQYENITLELAYATSVLNNNSWDVISAISKSGIGDTYWDIGDRKAVRIIGTVGTYYMNDTLYVFILDFNHPINKSTIDNNIIWGGFKTALTGGVDICICDSAYGSSAQDGTEYYTLNHKATTNYGGWKGCDFRYDVLGATSIPPLPYNNTKTTSTEGYNATQDTINNPISNTLLAALPNELRKILRLWNRYIDYKGNKSNNDANCSTATIDAISLLSEFEIFGTRTNANQYEQNHQKQMQYYSAGNSKIKYKYNAQSTSAYWWVSSPASGSTDGFCCIKANGTAVTDNIRYSNGFAPAFKT